MLFGRVIGTCVSSHKDSGLQGLKLLVVQPTDAKGVAPQKSSGGASGNSGIVVAIDSVGAGVGELILFATGSSARQTSVTRDKPVDAVIMAIVDSVEVEE
jgi:microcompartment protein CcmK/EutM